MKLETLPMKLQDRRIGVLVWAFVLAVVALPATAETVLHDRDVVAVLASATTHYYKKTKRRRVVESACYFDAQVEKSMACSWSSATGGANRVSMRQRVQRNGTKGCKKRGGSDCTLFLKNGKLKSDSLSPDDSAKLALILSNIPSYDSQAHPLPEGVEVGSDFRERFGKARDYWDDLRKRRRAHKLHYSLCAMTRQSWHSSCRTFLPTTRKHIRFRRELRLVATSGSDLAKPETTGTISEKGAAHTNYITHCVRATAAPRHPLLKRAEQRRKVWRRFARCAS